VAVEVRRQRQDRRRALRPHARRVRLPALRRRCRGRITTSRARRSRRRPSRRRRPATPSWARAIECDAHEYRGRIAALEPHARAAAIDDVGEERAVEPVDDGRGSCTAQAKRAPGPHRLGTPASVRERARSPVRGSAYGTASRAPVRLAPVPLDLREPCQLTCAGHQGSAYETQPSLSTSLPLLPGPVIAHSAGVRARRR
jgi:hypothetical protein